MKAPFTILIGLLALFFINNAIALKIYYIGDWSTLAWQMIGNIVLVVIAILSWRWFNSPDQAYRRAY
jgi:hypothetical protein